MTRPETSLPSEYFENMFRGTLDPWNLETSPYEQRKFARSVEVLGARTYDHVFEIGCAKGVLTSRLAPQATSLFAIDVSGTALRAARERCADLGHVGFANMRFPAQAPHGKFDLVVLSEVAYYWNDRDLGEAAEWLERHLIAGGDVLLVHWTGKTDYPQSGDGAVDKLKAHLGETISVCIAEHGADYRLDLWRKLK
ncbi:nodulation S family protein [Novosphingobium sp. 9]|uniref:nodulation S family protein n=1 Tax=Novosphingobium sp. 9 TaxID=2025349 RepID=UPI0021B64F2D|nr:nodulation S family protein [Novosphingobium sp. 9]